MYVCMHEEQVIVYERAYADSDMDVRIGLAVFLFRRVLVSFWARYITWTSTFQSAGLKKLWATVTHHIKPSEAQCGLVASH